MIPNIQRHRRVRYADYACLLITAAAGCASAARVQISAARSLDALTDAVQHAVDELHDEVLTADRRKRLSAVDAFVRRIRADHADDQRTQNHVDAFNHAIDRLREDADIEFARRVATLENLRAIREIAAGLRELGVQSMSLDDEARRYVTDLLQKPRTPDPKNGN